MNMKLLTTRQAAAQAVVTDNTIRDWIRKGQLPATRLPNNTYRIESEALAKILNPKLEGKHDGQTKGN